MVIREVDQAYKRGLVLGLTMAETVILMLFCLLLAMAAVLAWNREQLEKRDVAIAGQSERISDLEAATEAEPEDLQLVAILKEYWERYAPLDIEPREYFSQLRLQIEELERLRSDMERLVERNRFLEQQADNVQAQRVQLDQKHADMQLLEELVESLDAAGFDTDSPDDRARLQRALENLATLEGSDAKGQHDWPPIIILSEADDYHFTIGSAELSDSFRQQLINQVIPRLRELLDSYDVDVVEVIGHTDEQRVVGRVSNLDDSLRRVLQQGAPIRELVSADNAGLGLARAVSVARVLSPDPRLSHVFILPLSGGQLIDEDRMTDWARGGDVPARRRIEIRMRQSRQHPGQVLD